LFVAAFLLTLYFGVITDNPLPYHHLVDGFNDILLHLLAFGTLSLLSFGLWKNRLRVWVGLFLAGAIIELLQWFKPDRTLSLLDTFANIGGILIGAMLYWAIIQVLKRRIPTSS